MERKFLITIIILVVSSGFLPVVTAINGQIDQEIQKNLFHENMALSTQLN